LLKVPDGSGKSTAVRALCEQYPHAKVFHFGAPVEGEDQFTRYAEPMIDNPDRMLIYDRSWYSECVYGPIMREKSELNISHIRALEALVKVHGGGHILYLTTTAPILWARCTDRGETYIKDAVTLETICNKYEEVMKLIPTLPVFRVDTGK